MQLACTVSQLCPHYICVLSAVALDVAACCQFDIHTFTSPGMDCDGDNSACLTSRMNVFYCLSSIAGSPSSRRLQQFTCSAGCAPGACVATGTDGQRTCVACSGDNVVVRTDGSCHCPVGYYASNTDCLPCPKGKFCPGGLYNGAGSPVSYDCPANMTTRGLRGSSVLSCGANQWCQDDKHACQRTCSFCCC